MTFSNLYIWPPHSYLVVREVDYPGVNGKLGEVGEVLRRAVDLHRVRALLALLHDLLHLRQEAGAGVGARGVHLLVVVLHDEQQVAALLLLEAVLGRLVVAAPRVVHVPQYRRRRIGVVLRPGVHPRQLGGTQPRVACSREERKRMEKMHAHSLGLK